MDQRTIEQVDERIKALADSKGTDDVLLALLAATYATHDESLSNALIFGS